MHFGPEDDQALTEAEHLHCSALDLKFAYTLVRGTASESSGIRGIMIEWSTGHQKDVQRRKLRLKFRFYALHVLALLEWSSQHFIIIDCADLVHKPKALN